MAGGVACAVPAPPSARGVRTGPHGRDALLRVRGTCVRGLGFASNRLTRRARRFPARGKRKSPKRFCPLPFVLIVDTEGGWGKMSSRFPRGENENLMRNKLRALNWFGQALSDDLLDFASKQCAFNPNCGKTTVHPVRPRLMQRRAGPSEFRLPFSPSRRYARRPLPVARERDPSGRKRGDVGGMWIPGSGH